MSPDELRRAAIRMYGRKHWMRDLSANLGKNVSTVWRWFQKEDPVDTVVEVAVRGLLERHKVLYAAEKARREERARLRHRYKGKKTVKKFILPPDAEELPDE